MKSRIVVSLIASVFAVFLLELAAEIMLPPVNQTPALAWDSDNQLLIHAPNTYGTRYLDGHPVGFRMNAQGWNAPYDYPLNDHTQHLAVIIGDSFVEALQVDPYAGLTANLQRELGTRWRVYGMGISGAPLSQYLQMARAAERTYHPDIIIVVLVHNDFLESYDPPSNQLYRSFWTTDGVKMIQPAVYHPTVASRVMASPFMLGRLVVTALAPHPAAPSANWQMGIDVTRNLAHMADMDRITYYLFSQFAQLAKKTSLLFLMDAPRDVIEQGRYPQESPVFEINMTARTLASANGLRFLDTSQAFLTNWQEHHQLFSFQHDYHWNAYAHDLMARTIMPMVVHQ